MRAFLPSLMLVATVAIAQPPPEGPEEVEAGAGLPSEVAPIPVVEPPAEVAPKLEVETGEQTPPRIISSEVPLPGADAPQEELAVRDPRRQRLVSGAPLYNPNVAVHVVQRKAFSDLGRHELVLYPLAAQANGRFTQHLGSALGYLYHLHENLALQVLPQFNWHANESDFNRELIAKVREEAQAASSLLLHWGVTAGVEVTPLYGKFAFYEGSLGQFSLVLSGGAGLASTRHQLRPGVGELAASFGDTGSRFLGSIGAGLRMQFGKNVTARLEVRDLVYTARVDRVNGCDATELRALDEEVRSGAESLAGVPVGPGCRVERFEGQDPATGQSRMHDVPLALGLVETPSSDALNNVGIYLGIGFVF